MSVEETKVIYHIDDEETPYLIKLPIPPEKVTLGDFKNALNRPTYKFFFKSLDDDFGIVKEELVDDESKLPCFNGRVVSWLVTAENSTHSSENQNISLTTTKHSPSSDLSTMVAARPTSYCGKEDGKPIENTDIEFVLASKKTQPHIVSYENKQRMLINFDVASTVMTSDIESVSVLDTDDTQSRCSGTTTRSSAYFKNRKKKYRHRMPLISQASSMSSITDSTMSLNVITVTLNMETVNFLGISIVGQTNNGGDGGIYVGSIMKGGAVALDGRIEPGDMILEVNGVSFEDMSNDEAVHALRSAAQRPGPVTLVVAKCWDPNPKGYNMTPIQEVVHPIDPSAWVAHTEAVRTMYGKINPPMPGLCNNDPAMLSTPQCSSPTLEPLTASSDPLLIVQALIHPDSGLDIRDRMWLKITIPHAFIGSDLVTWLLTHVEGFADRRDARKFACNLLKRGFIKHTVNKLSFSEQCYYTIVDSSQPALQTRKQSVSDDLEQQTESTEIRIYDTLGPPSTSVDWNHPFNKVASFTTTFTPNPSNINYVPSVSYNFINDALSVDSLHITNGSDTIKSGSDSAGSNQSQLRNAIQPQLIENKRGTFVQGAANTSISASSATTTTTVLNSSTSSSHSDDKS